MFSDQSRITYKFVIKRLKENLQMFRKKASDLQITHEWCSVNILNLLPMKRRHVRIHDGLTQCPERNTELLIFTLKEGLGRSQGGGEVAG